MRQTGWLTLDLRPTRRPHKKRARLAARAACPAIWMVLGAEQRGKPRAFPPMRPAEPGNGSNPLRDDDKLIHHQSSRCSAWQQTGVKGKVVKKLMSQARGGHAARHIHVRYPVVGEAPILNAVTGTRAVLNFGLNCGLNCGLNFGPGGGRLTARWKCTKPQ